MKKWILLVIPILVFTGAAGAIPAPSAVYCILQGYDFEIRTDEYGNQYGVCVFPDGSECGAWAYYCKCEPNACFPGNFTCHWPCKEMRCKEAGESVLVSKCCEGLGEIYPAHIFDDTCNRLDLVGWLFLCSDCGNGICEDWENRCNCHVDCGEPSIIYVDDDANGANDGSSWSNAFNNLSNALNFALPGDEIRVAQGTYKPTPSRPGQAGNPDPADGATDVSIDAVLSWIPGARATSHKVYFGTSSLPPFVRSQAATTFHPTGMNYKTTYYWRIDSVNVWGESIGAVWSFTTSEVPPPPLRPTPMNLSNGRAEEVTSVDRTATFTLKNGVAIKGGYAGYGEADPDVRDIELYETILSGDLAGNDRDVNDPADLLDDPCRAENSYHVVTGSGTDETAVLDGFTITGGNANGVSYICAGGGMYNDSGSPTLTNCLFVSNSAETGGGIWNRFSKNLIIINCTFRRNQARMWAGGMYNLDSNLCLNNCIFIENLSGFCGGGVDSLYSSLKLFNCKFSGNAAAFSGGGIHWDDPFDVIIINCLFVGNSSEYGGAISGEIGLGYPTIIKNCTFSFNLAEGKGGGLHIHLPPAPCVSPQSIKYDWGCYISNCILWGDIPDEIYDTWAVITYSDVEGGWPGEGNIDTDPCFVQLGYWEVGLPPEPPQPPIPPPPPPPPGSPPPPNNEYYTWFEGNYHLLPDSPCIDAGDPCYVAEPNETDLDGKPRVLDGNGDTIAVVDMGAYESMPPIPAEVRITPRTINLASKSKWLTCYIWLPDNYSITDIDSNAIFIFGKIQAESVQVSEKQQVAIAEFSREEVQTILNTGEVELSIIGWLIDGTVFEGRDLIRVTSKRGGKPDKYDQASNPNPADGATGVDINADLSWTASPYAISHDVYFGTSNPPPFVYNQTAITFDPDTMDYETRYYWRIDEVSKWGVTDGQPWSFTTEEGVGKPPGAPPGCFPADTPVWIDGAQVQISKVTAGQKVGKLDATNAVSGFEKPEPLKEIESVLEYQGTDDYYNIVLENGNRINVVHSHYFLTASDQWVRVENLKAGSKLQSLKGPVSIKTIAKGEVPFTGRFYNLKIKGGDRYFVGKDGVTVRGH